MCLIGAVCPTFFSFNHLYLTLFVIYIQAVFGHACGVAFFPCQITLSNLPYMLFGYITPALIGFKPFNLLFRRVCLHRSELMDESKCILIW